MKTTYITLLLFLSLYHLAAQNTYYTKSFSSTQLREDFLQYKSVMQELHPSLYWYTPKDELEGLMDEVEEKLVNPMSEYEFYQLLAPITAKINCGHTGTIPSYASRTSLNNRIPLEFRYVDGKLYLFYDYEDKTYPLKEVKLINSQTTTQILQKISGLKGTDGFIQTPDPLFFNNSNSFGYNFHLVYKANQYEIEFADGTSISRSPISADSLGKINRVFYPERPIIASRIQKDSNVAVLTINTFDKYPFKQKKIAYKKFLADFFREIKSQKIGHLIIDLRNNGGGEDNYASLLYRYLTDQPFKYYTSMEANPLPFDKEIVEQVNLPTEVKNGFIRQFFIKRIGDRFFVKPTFRTKGLRTQKPKTNHFDGKLYFLVSGESYSASAELVAYCEAYRSQTVFIGEEAGGAVQGNTSAIFAFSNLKHTQLGTYIPLVRYTMNISKYEEGRGVQPDYPLANSLEGMRLGIDDVLDFALKLTQE